MEIQLFCKCPHCGGDIVAYGGVELPEDKPGIEISKNELTQDEIEKLDKIKHEKEK